MIIKKVIGFDEVYAVIYRKKRRETSLLYRSEKIRLSKLPEAKGFWYADPMLFHFESDTYLFMEAYEYKRQKGCIAYSKLQRDGLFTCPEVVIREEYHMSFPVVFEWQDGIYLMPETSENRSFELYKCREFPLRWDKVAMIDIQNRLVDAIILEKTDDDIRLLASEIDDKNPLRAKYQIYTVKKLEGRYTISPDLEYNEKQEYAYDTRNAGTLFKENEKWMHPVQVSTDIDYGVNIDMFFYQGIEKIHDRRAFVGKIGIDDIVVSGIEDRKMIGVHTYCCDGDIEVLDVRYHKFILKKWYYKLMGKFKDKKR